MADAPLSFALVPGWEQLPEGCSHRDVAGVAVDSRDHVYLFCRDEHPVLVYDRAGRFLRAWGAGLFPRAHGITVGPDDSGPRASRPTPATTATTSAPWRAPARRSTTRPT